MEMTERIMARICQPAIILVGFLFDISSMVTEGEYRVGALLISLGISQKKNWVQLQYQLARNYFEKIKKQQFNTHIGFWKAFSI